MQEILLEVVEKTDMRGREFSIFIIDEPEAGVTFALRHENIRENIEKGSNFIVCDAGGGTVVRSPKFYALSSAVGDQ
jgi:hypothetical protein